MSAAALNTSLSFHDPKVVFCEHEWNDALLAPPEIAWPDIMVWCRKCGVKRCDAQLARDGIGKRISDNESSRCLLAVHHGPTPHIEAQGTWQPVGGYEREFYLSRMFPKEEQ